MHKPIREVNQVAKIDCPHCQKNISILLMGFANPQYNCSLCDQQFRLNIQTEIKNE